MSLKKAFKKAVEFVAVKSAKMACGTASVNLFGQPKEPACLKAILAKKK